MSNVDIVLMVAIFIVVSWVFSLERGRSGRDVAKNIEKLQREIDALKKRVDELSKS